jgi:hypothetical protein
MKAKYRIHQLNTAKSMGEIHAAQY